ncbi:MAG: glycosyltransferase family 1 protein [Chlamydiota bacterium]|nr:glycosyltransferase family 1 protein [Chlamydiota bacterium]
MRIGMMLRPLDEKGGIGVYTQNMLKELLAIDRKNHYVLFYRNPVHLGSYSHYKNVTERVVRAPNKALWDQLAIPYACWKEKIDLVFHTKFTAPLLAPCKAVMVFHGADWFIPEHAKFYKGLDVRYIKMMMPLYCKKCCTILSVSQITTDNFVKILNLPPEKVKTVYFGPGKHFKRIEEAEKLKDVKEKYQLPDQFILTLSGYDRGTRKNIDRILEAYRLFHGKTEHKLVIGGKDCYKFMADYQVPSDGYGKDILFPGWIDQKDLPAIYSLASLYLYPSNVEAFPIPLTEAMTCGTPVITSNLNGLKEIADDGALFVDADNPQEIADALEKVLTNPELQNELGQKGLNRSKVFSWEKCARETLGYLESAK